MEKQDKERDREREKEHENMVLATSAIASRGERLTGQVQMSQFQKGNLGFQQSTEIFERGVDDTICVVRIRSQGKGFNTNTCHVISQSKSEP